MKRVFLVIFLIIIFGTTIFLIKKFTVKEPTLLHQIEEKELFIFNWEDYISKEVIDNFEKEFKIKVHLDTFKSSDEVLPILQSESEKYDLIVIEDDLVSQFKKLKLLSPLNHSKIPNLQNLKKQAKENSYDPGNAYCVPYVNGFTGIAINEKYVKDFDGTRKILWDEKYKGRISLPNLPEEILVNALFYRGYPLENPNEDQLKEAFELALKQKPLVIGYDDPIKQRELMINEEAWIALIFSTEVLPIQESNPNIKFFAPKEGVLLWADNFCIPKNAKHKEAAHLFLNYLLEPKISAKNSEDIGNLMSNEKMIDFLSSEFKEKTKGLDFPLERETFLKSSYFTGYENLEFLKKVNEFVKEME
jgi:spermidine/putrescine transport system substrate-binding protein